MKFSTGNQIKGKIMEIRKGAVTAIVYVAIPGDTMLEASVTIASLETLGLYEGKSVVPVVNPGDIIIGCDSNFITGCAPPSSMRMIRPTLIPAP